MMLRILLLLILLPLTASADDLLREYYQRVIPTVDRFMQRFPHADQNEPTSDFTVFTLFNNIAIIVSTNADLPEDKRIPMKTATRLLHIAEEMQDKNPDSRTFGNFRWYWNSPGVTDANAAEFALARMLSIYLDTPSPISEEDRVILYRLLERSVNACLNRRIRPDYTNIAFYNAVHLILLGQVLERTEVLQEGKRRLNNIAEHIWNHGVFEYNSPDYYPINVDALQLGLRHVKDAETKQMIHVLLELFWTDMSLHWFSPNMRLAGAQSRTYHYLHGGNVHIHRLCAFAGLAPYDHDARYHAVLNSYRALYQPPPEIVALNEQYPRWVTRNWGRDPGQWAAMLMFDDIALSTAGAKYDARQNMVLTVDIANSERGELAPRLLQDKFHWVHWRYPPRSYFIADGREDPYGTKRSPTGSGGQPKALHLDAQWFGSQRSVDAFGIVLYSPESLADPTLVNVQSHFVIHKPESILLADSPGESIKLPPHQPVALGNRPVVFRYKTCAFGIRVVWARNHAGEPAEVVLLNDGNEHSVYRLTVEHGLPHNLAGTPLADTSSHPGAALWLRIGSRLETDEQFADWKEQFIAATVNRLEVDENDIDIEVAGQDGIVSVKLTDGIVSTIPDAPLGILSLDSTDLGRPILERASAIADLAERRDTALPIVIAPSGTRWHAVPSEVLTVNQNTSWQIQIDVPGTYHLRGLVQTIDAQHDSFRVETAKRLPDGSFMRRSFLADWHLGVRKDWTWVRLPVPIYLDEGIWQLTLKPREYEGRIEQLLLIMDSR